MENQNVQPVETNHEEKPATNWKDYIKGGGLFLLTVLVLAALILGGVNAKPSTVLLESKYSQSVAKANSVKQDFFTQVDEVCKVEVELAKQKLQDFLSQHTNATKEEVEVWSKKVFGENLSCQSLF